ncbi:RxLR effector protein [Phytophthora megakarya]|uniref:RxLR effector protein n=1 Tax=Phytophthora megakarya TaxID=4795 RepID=A0A225WHJ1_9STRA|nr:RxLR effector protein [Phytophthora megakarya]
MSLLLVVVGITISVAADPKINGQHPSLFNVEDNGSPSQRMLRSYTIENVEERGIPGWNTVKLNLWLRNGKSVDDALTTLRLGEKLDDIVANPKLKVLVKYDKMLSEKYPDNPAPLIKMLSSRYGDDVVAMTLLSARQIENTKDIAKKLHFQQMESWMTRGDSADEVFKLLKISDEGPKFVESQKLSILAGYMDYVSIAKPQEKMDFFTTLRNGFGGDKKFAIVVSQAVDEAYTDASLMQNMLFQSWHANKIKPTNLLEDIFKINPASAGAQEKSIVNRYTEYYQKFNNNAFTH